MPNTEYYDELEDLTQDANRFCSEPDQGTTNDQRREKIIRQIGALDEFRPTTEKELENYVDIAARRIKTRRVCPELF
ncbi:MAG: hypothetical protein KVP17_003016 [Porospora cf. gigantea B]|nr:MAG: hypothetical protein KVP17_003016 [Porospora cf. gigantea B]